VAIALYVLKESCGIIRASFAILMQGAPKGLDVIGIAGEIEGIEGVEKVHHVHVWSLDEHNVHFEAHVNVNDMPVSQTKPLLEEIRCRLLPYGIGHVTVQFEYRCCDGVGVIKE